MSPQAPLSEEYIRTRVPGAMKERVARANERYGVSESVLIRDALVAILDYIDREDGYRRPVMMVRVTAQLQAVAESQLHYGPAKAVAPPKQPDKPQRGAVAGPAHRVPKSA